MPGILFCAKMKREIRKAGDGPVLDANGVRETIVREYIAARRLGKPSRPALFLGPSGVGKTAGVLAAAREIARLLGEVFLDYGEFSRLPEKERENLLEGIKAQGKRPFFFVDVLLLSHEPSDFSGIPREGQVGGSRVTRFIPMEWAALLASYPGIVFLDEITNVNRDDIRGVAYKLVDEKRAGSIVFSPEVKIVAAGNAPEESSVALPLPAPLLNRMAVYRVGPPTAEAWYNYARKKWPHADPFLLGYLAKLASKPETPEAPETLRQFTSPRSCECLLEAELEFRLGWGETLSPEEMRLKATAWLGTKEGELLASYWARRQEILDFLRGEKAEGQFSPALLWAIGVLAGRTVASALEEEHNYGDEWDDLIIENLDHILSCLLREYGKEYVVPVFWGMDAFVRGSDPRLSSQRALYCLRRLAGKAHEEARTLNGLAQFSVQAYFARLWEREFYREAEGAGEEGRLWAEVAARLLADQREGVLKVLEKGEMLGMTLEDVVGSEFASSIRNFNTLENWQAALGQALHKRAKDG